MLKKGLVVMIAAVVLGGAGLRADDPIASPESVGFSTAGLKAFQAGMRALVDESKLAGVTTLVARHGKVVHFDAYGKRDLETGKPVEKDTIFRIASMTKPIVGVAMMMLWEEGKWTLDDPVSKHIPEFAGLKVATPNGEVAQTKPMTMRQLMSHTAGFDTSGGYEGKNIIFSVEASKADRVTKMHTYGDDKKIKTAPTQADPTRKPVFLSGGGGLLSTTGDYLKFAQMVLNGGQANGKRFLKASTVELMRTNVLADGVKVDLYGPNYNIEGIGFGLDFAIILDPAKANTPEGKNSFYWGGAFGTWFWLDPTNDMLVIGMMQNLDGSRPDRGSPQVRPLSRKLVYAALVDPKK
jgi:CubicO group peptidase (beta-lactamase class C family)